LAQLCKGTTMDLSCLKFEKCGLEFLSCSYPEPGVPFGAVCVSPSPYPVFDMPQDQPQEFWNFFDQNGQLTLPRKTRKWRTNFLKDTLFYDFIPVKTLTVRTTHDLIFPNTFKANPKPLKTTFRRLSNPPSPKPTASPKAFRAMASALPARIGGLS
jgi:hypothetical protein